MSKKKVLSLIGSLCLILLILASFTMSACSSPKEEETSPILLRWSDTPPRGKDSAYELTIQMLADIEEKTGGRVKTEYYGGGELASGKEMYEAISKGVVDIAMSQSYQSGALPKTEMLSIPFMCTDRAVMIKVMNELIDKYFNAEYERNGLKVIFQYWRPTFHIFSRDSLTSLEDFKGVIISAPNEVIGKGLEALGFSPRIIPGSEIYLNAQKGVIDATANQLSTVKMESLQEVYDYILLCDFSQVVGACVINPEKYNSMPEDVREIVVNELLKYKQDLFELEEAGLADILQWCKDNGFTVNTLSKENRELMQETVAHLLEEWIVAQEKGGMTDAREFVEEFIKLTDSYLAE